MYFFILENMVSIKVDKILSKAYELSNLSTQNFNHAAIITKGSKPITFGINNNRSMINGKMAICSHAEVHAILKWRNSHFRGVKDRDRKAKKYDLYVIRRNNNGDQSNFSNSQPCKTCAKLIKQCNFGHVIYSTGESDICKKVKGSEMISTHRSSAYKYLEKNINYFSRLNYI